MDKSRDGLLGVSRGASSEMDRRRKRSATRAGGSRVSTIGVPFLLLPVRIETRFFGGADKPELRVRIFPDDVAITTHETALSAGEAEAGASSGGPRAPRCRWPTAGTREAGDRRRLDATGAGLTASRAAASFSFASGRRTGTTRRRALPAGTHLP